MNTAELSSIRPAEGNARATKAGDATYDAPASDSSKEWEQVGNCSCLDQVKAAPASTSKQR